MKGGGGAAKTAKGQTTNWEEGKGTKETVERLDNHGMQCCAVSTKNLVCNLVSSDKKRTRLKSRKES